MSAAAYPQSFSYERVFIRAYDILRNNLVLLGTLAVVLYGIPRVAAAFMHIITNMIPFFPHGIFGATGFLYWVIAGLGAFALQAAVTYVAANEMNGRTATAPEAIRFGIRFILPILGIFLVTVIAVVAGCILLIIPGLFVATIWSVATPAAVVERLDVGSALSRSSALTSGYRWPVFGLLAIFVIGVGLVTGTVTGIQSGFLHPFSFLHGVSEAAHEVTEAIFDVIGSLIGALGVMSIYYELRVIKEGAGPEDLSSLLPE